MFNQFYLQAILFLLAMFNQCFLYSHIGTILDSEVSEAILLCKNLQSQVIVESELLLSITGTKG
jgi:hypothetical protein